uniref:Uncharacterized protein n=1 Tax=uncultured Thiotrichaceae bacterium TaxID=298394 RepID=A0A6S6U976_9GAMM|nr:MAG: Unknown protein [uncultured Thiotrichaceae bacterium]
MNEQAEENKQLEQELRTVWKKAANTRKATSPRRIEALLYRSRAELSLRDLLTFFIYLGKAFFNLLLATLHILFIASKPAEKRRSKSHD